jgi:hypothetical protein
MPRARTTILSPEERATVIAARDHHPLFYSRERAAAILKVADGWSVRRVARDGLLHDYCPETVSGWIDQFEARGVVALVVRPGRGRKPADARAELAPQQAAEAILETVHQSPRATGVERSRWTLAALMSAILWLKGMSVSGLSRLLRGFRIRYRRGQEYLHSPDPEYRTKMDAVMAARIEAVDRPAAVVFLYQDELTTDRRPSVARAWHEVGGPGRPAPLGEKANTERRVIGTLNAVTGRLFSWQRAHADVDTLIRYYRALSEAYPAAEVIYVAQDNWPVHFHERIREAVKPLRIQLLRLPTYAPWTNPIEKVWRRLKQEVLHQHDFGDDWPKLKAAVTKWLDQWANGSLDLLHYVGLYPS